jgi:hypothetical protein
MGVEGSPQRLPSVLLTSCSRCDGRCDLVGDVFKCWGIEYVQTRFHAQRVEFEGRAPRLP